MMMNAAEAGSVLSDRGLEELLPLRPLARRLGCDVWQGELFTPYGDAKAEIQIYRLQQEPVTVVDMEEEITALEHPSSSRALAYQVRDDEHGVLIVCAKTEEAIFRRFFTEGIPRERSITYHPQLDRILGGDYFHQLNGRWLKACLSSIPRALMLRDLLETAATSYAEAPVWDSKLESPLPRLLAVLSVPAIDLPGAPEEYKEELALTQFVIASPETVQVKPPEARPQTIAFCRQLFGLVEAAHRAGVGFSRDAGCCLRPEFLIADGSLSDAYFLCELGAGEAAQNVMQRDVWNALLVSSSLASADVDLTFEMLTLALSQYTTQTAVAPRVLQMLRAAAEGMARSDPAPMQALAATCFRKR